MRDNLVLTLQQLAEPSIREFNRKIVSDTHYPMLGVRVPQLRRLGKKAGCDWRLLLSQSRFETYEETLTVGLAIAYGKEPLADRLDGLRRLLPRLDSWGMTDTIAPTLKPKAHELPLLWDFAGECLESELEHTVRFGIVLMLDEFLIPEYIPAVVERIAALNDGRYYVQMAAAWLLAELGVQDFERVCSVLLDECLDCFTHNMTIRKLRESYRITPEQKQAALLLKRKEKQNENHGN